MLVSLVLWLTPPRSAQAAPEGAVNACGCGRDTTGSCFCQKVARCGCPGECEPKGCEEKRAKQLEKEILAETKRAAEDDRKRNAAQAAATSGGDSSREPVRAKAARFEAASAAPRPAKAPAPKKMTASQKKELVHLLEAYLAENPERRSRTAEQIRSDLR